MRRPRLQERDHIGRLTRVELGLAASNSTSLKYSCSVLSRGARLLGHFSPPRIEAHALNCFERVTKEITSSFSPFLALD